MTYSENEILKLENIYDIHRGPNEFIPIDGLLIKNKNIDSFFFDNFQNNYIPKDSIEEKSIFLMPNLGELKDKKKEKEDSIPSIYTFEDILQKFQNKDKEKNKLKELFKRINFVEKIEEVKKYIQFLEKKRSSPDYDYDSNELIEQKNKNINNNIVEKTIKLKRRGRQSKKHNNMIHDKMKSDNIIKKLKGKIFEYAILFLNIISNKKDKGEKLVNLNYNDYINGLNRKENLKYLNMKLKDLFSQDISLRFSTKPKDFNKKLIKKILNKNTDETIKFAFNITLRDWLDLFTLKKSVEELLKENNFADKDIDYGKIKESIFDVGEFLNEIMDKNGNEYLTPFIFLLYNYERWFSIKKERKKRKK